MQEAIARLACQQKHAGLNAFVFQRSRDEVLSLVEKNANVGAFRGRLFGIKANFCVENWPSHACSRALENYKSPFSATVVERIEREGGVCMGLTNMDEFGMGSTGETSVFGPTLNPWSAQFSTGGSSSGSAVAVATNSVFCAIGSDTGGSVRLPASHCGVVGFKPSRGSISRFGLIAYSSSLDTPGILCNHVADVKAVFKVLAGADGKDMTCVDIPSAGAASTDTAPCRIGLAKEFHFPEMNSSVVHAWEQSASLLAEESWISVVASPPGSFPSIGPLSLAAYYVIALAEASSNLARYDGVRYGHRTKAQGLQLHDEYAKTRSEGFGEEVQRRILMGSLALTHTNETCYYSLAREGAAKIRQEFDKAFTTCDVLLLPTSPFTPDSRNQVRDPVEKFLEDTLTVPSSLAGLPSCSVPVGVCRQTGAPIGIQVIGRHGEDLLVLRVAQALETRAKFTPYSSLV